MTFDQVLITGGAGYFGRHCARELLRRGAKRVCIYSRDEHKHAQMEAEFGNDPRLRFFVGCVRDRERLTWATNGIGLVIHAAALKRIQTGFYNPEEVKKTNIDGAVNVIHAAQYAPMGRAPCPRRVVFLSTDKAVEAVSPYGRSKAYAEDLFLSANNTRGESGPIYAICRYGNVAGSTGSVIPLWREILRTNDTVPVADPEVTRFYMTPDEAVELVLRTADGMVGGEIAVPTLPAYRLGDLAAAMGAKMRVCGLGEFEKRHELMERGVSSEHARRMSVPEIRAALEALNA